MTDVDLITKIKNMLDRCKNEPREPLKLVGTPEQISVWKKMFGENACTYIERVEMADTSKFPLTGTQAFIDECSRAQPKYKRVCLDEMKKKMTTGSVAFKQNETSAVFTNTVDYIYNRAIDDIKSKYGDLYVEVK